MLNLFMINVVALKRAQKQNPGKISSDNNMAFMLFQIHGNDVIPVEVSVIVGHIVLAHVHVGHLAVGVKYKEIVSTLIANELKHHINVIHIGSYCY